MVVCVCAFAVPAAGQERIEAVTEALDSLDTLNGEPSRPEEPAPAPRVPLAQKPPKTLPSSKTLMLDVLQFENVSIREALRQIEAKSGVIITVSPEVDADVSFFIQNVNLWDALKLLLQPNKMAYSFEDGIVNVMTENEYLMRYGQRFGEEIQARIIPIRYAQVQDLVGEIVKLKSEDAKIYVNSRTKTVFIIDHLDNLSEIEDLMTRYDVPLTTKIFYLRFASADEVYQAIKDSLTPHVGRADYGTISKELTVTDTDENLNKIAGLIRQADKKKEAFFNIEVVQVVLNEEHENGIDWEAIVADFRVLEKEQAPGPRQQPGVSIGKVTREDYDILVDALDTVGEVKDHASPDITVLHEQKAYVRLTPTDNDVTLTVAAPASERGENPVLSRDDTGLSFFLIPEINDKASFRVVVEPIDENKYDLAKVSLTTDEVVVIGGVRREKAILQTRKFPLLGDLPLFGPFFQNEYQKLKTAEYVIFLKPKILITSVSDILPDDK